ncbi:hypothetical protein L6258_01470, partial [Candidatus Parcubacteria bacterium]|nr:hypothetical protein [Candidatus Parcubacteria bacterium]
MDGDGIGISIGCWLPWVILPGGLQLAAKCTEKTGCTFWQMLPLRNVTLRALRRAQIPVHYAEPAWNPITLWNKLRKQPGAEGGPAKWQDVVFFPRPEVSQDRFWDIQRESEAVPIYHNFNMVKAWGGLLEIHPELSWNHQALKLNSAEILHTKQPYVLDARHLRRPTRGGEPSPLGPWQKALEVLLPYTALVHVQPLEGKELIRSLNGENTELVQILMYLKGRYDGPFVIEVPPNLLGPTYFL